MRARRGVAPAVAVVLAAGLLVGCSSGTAETAAPPTSTTSPSTTEPTDTGSMALGPAARPARLVAPDDVTAPAPLVVLLHGYRSNAEQQDGYLGVSAQAAGRGLYVLLPDGTEGPGGNRFWDATGACCNFTGTPVDDVGYLAELIEEAIAARPIDPDRVYVFGHSNGGFMAYQLACGRADLVTAIAVLAGADRDDEAACEPSEPVSVLHLHGDADTVIDYDGGRITEPYPSAPESVRRWAERDGCTGALSEDRRVDLVADLVGEETAVAAYGGCPDGVEVELATIEAGSHVPAFDQDHVGTDVLDWLLAHRR